MTMKVSPVKPKPGVVHLAVPRTTRWTPPARSLLGDVLHHPYSSHLIPYGYLVKPCCPWCERHISSMITGIWMSKMNGLESAFTSHYETGRASITR